jgi:DNA-binding transcriptional ArsR family regulator
MDDSTNERLDKIIFLLGLAFRNEIEQARQAVLSDPVAAAVLDASAGDWIGAGDLKRQVAAATKQSERTVSRRISQLAEQGWLTTAGAGPTIRYRATGLA